MHLHVGTVTARSSGRYDHERLRVYQASRLDEQLDTGKAMLIEVVKMLTVMMRT